MKGVLRYRIDYRCDTNFSTTCWKF